MAKLFDITVTTGTYELNGEKKYRSKNIGTVWEGKNGPYLRLDRTFNPAGVPSTDPAADTIICNMWEPRDKDAQPKPQQAKNYTNPQTRAPEVGGFDDTDIPFMRIMGPW